MKINDVINNAIAGALTVALIWIATNVVWASDMAELKEYILYDQRRDISRDLRALEAQEELTESELEWQAQLEDEFDQIQEAIDALVDGD